MRVAAADLNGDGFADIVAGTGPGGSNHVTVFDGSDRHELGSFTAYDNQTMESLSPPYRSQLH